jgi:hypothetical protein
MKQQKNDIPIFVEDASNCNMWINFLCKLLPESCKFETVIPLGGRKNVLEACKASQNVDLPCLFIIDADLDILLNIPKPNLKHLYRLRSYSIENYLLQPVALYKIAMTYSTTSSKKDIVSKIDFDGWLDENRACLETLFRWYALSKLMNSSEKTVGYKVQQLLIDVSASRQKLCPKNVIKRVRKLLAGLKAKHKRAELVKNIKEIRARQRNLDILRYVSCKDYIMPQIQNLMKREFAMNAKSKVFNTQLADHSPKDVDPYLKNRLLRIINK